MTNRRDHHASAALVTAALGGDAAAMGRLVHRLHPVLRARLRHAGAAPGAAAVEALWVRLLGQGGRRLRAYDPTLGITLEGFVGALAAREIGAERTPVAEPPIASAGEVADARLTRDLLAHLEVGLSAKGRVLLCFLYRDGCSVAETADALGITQQVVHDWQHKIRRLARAWGTQAREVG